MPVLPALVSRTASWPDNLNAQIGPFEYPTAATPCAPWAERAGPNVTFGTGSGTEYVAQAFTPPVDCTTDQIQLPVVKVGAPADNLVVEVQSDSAGAPSGTVVYTTSTAGSSLFATAPNRWTTAAVGGALAGGTTYHLVAHRSGASDAVNYYAWARNPATDTAMTGVGNRSTRAYGGSWSATAKAAGESMGFRLQNAAVTTSVLYLPLVDAVLNSAVMHRSVDGGVSWHRCDANLEQAMTSTVGERCLAAFYYATSVQLQVAYAAAAGGYAVRTFNPVTGTWLTSVSFTTGARGTTVAGVGAVWIGEKVSDASMYVFYQGPVENVAGTDYRRIKVTRGPSTVTTYDAITGTTSLPATAVHYDARAHAYATPNEHYVWTQSDDAFVHTRYTTNVGTTTTWKAVTTLAATVDNAAAYPIGRAEFYASPVQVVVPYVDGAATKVTKAQAGSAETAGNWSIETIFATGSETTDAVPVAVVAESNTTIDLRLFAFRVVAGADRAVEWTNNRGGTTWIDPPVPWRGLAGVVCGGFSGRGATARLSIAYVDTAAPGGAAVYYDELPVFCPRVSRAAGTVTTIIDLKRDMVSTDDPFTISLDTAAGTGSVVVTAYTGDSPDPVLERGAIGVGDATTDSYGEVVIGDVQRYVKVVAVSTGASFTYGAIGW